jgi:type I restriction enzyme R subunit
VQADEIVQVVDPVNIFEREAFEAEVDKATSPRAKADTIANRTKRTITEKMEEDPFFYRKFSLLIEQAIEDYRAQRLSDADYLSKMKSYMESVRKGRSSEVPQELQERDLARALYGSLKTEIGDHLNTASGTANGQMNEDAAAYNASSSGKAIKESLLAEASCQMEDIIRRHSIVGWRENEDAQNRMRNEMDDYLFEMQNTQRIQHTLEQMDAFIEAALRIARNRTQDV